MSLPRPPRSAPSISGPLSLGPLSMGVLLIGLGPGCVFHPPVDDGVVVEQYARVQAGEVAAEPTVTPIPKAIPRPLPRRPRHPVNTVRATYGIGSLEQKSAGPPRLDDSATTNLARFELERVDGLAGGGVQVSGWFPGGMHEGSSVGRTQTWLGEVYPHLTLRPTVGELFRMPVRVGPLFHYTEQDFDAPPGGHVQRYSVGGRAEIAPEFDIMTRPGMRLSLYGDAHYGFGRSRIDVRSPAVNNEFDTQWQGLGVGFGLRLLWDDLDGQLGYQHTRMDFDRSDPEQGILLPGSDFRFHGFVLSVGGRW